MCRMAPLILYYLQLVLLTLGTPVLCGFAVRLCAGLFGRLSGTSRGAVFDLTAVLGTPVHELGHAMMCPLFGHKITRICLWSPRHTDGRYGFVEHSYNKRNPWARIGSIFIGVGPIFSGMAVVVLVLWLCFPSLWSEYLVGSSAAVASGKMDLTLLSSIFSLLLSLPRAIVASPVSAILGILLILSVCLHISLSAQDIKAALRAVPLYLLLLAVIALVTMAAKVDGTLLSWVRLFHLRMLSLFALVIAFSLIWVFLALLVRFIKRFISWF